MDKASNHVDWCAVDPANPQPKFVLALKHESGDTLIRSNDGGEKWSEPILLPKRINPNSPLTWIAYDTGHDTLYVAHMSADLFRMAREK